MKVKKKKALIYFFINVIYKIINNYISFILRSFSTYGFLNINRNMISFLGFIIDYISWFIAYCDLHKIHGYYLFRTSDFKTELYANNGKKKYIMRYIYVEGYLDASYIEDLGVAHVYLEPNFLYLWKFYKYIEYPIIFFEKYWNVKNYPAWFLLMYITKLILDQSTISPVVSYMNILNYELNLQNNPQIILDEKVSKALNFIKQFDKKRIELLVYMVYDLYIHKNTKYNYKGEKILKFSESPGCDTIPYYLFLNVIGISPNAAYVFVQENKFYNLDQNLNFFIEVFKYYSIIDDTKKIVNDEEKHKDIYNKIHYYISKELEYYSKVNFYVSCEIELKNEGFERIRNIPDSLPFDEWQALHGVWWISEDKIRAIMENLFDDLSDNWNKNKGPELIKKTFKELIEMYEEYQSKNVDINTEPLIKKHWKSSNDGDNF